MSKLRPRCRGASRTALLAIMAVFILASVTVFMARSHWSHQQAQAQAPESNDDNGALIADTPSPTTQPGQDVEPGGQPHHAWGGPEWGRHEWGHHEHGRPHFWGRHEFNGNPEQDNLGQDNDDHANCCRHHGHHQRPTVATITGLSDIALSEETPDGWSKTLVLNSNTRYWQGWGGPQVSRAQVAVGQTVMVREDTQENGLRCAADVTILQQPEHPAAATSVATATVTAENTPPEKKSPFSDLYLRWLGFGGLMAGLVEAERRRRRRRRQGQGVMD